MFFFVLGSRVFMAKHSKLVNSMLQWWKTFWVNCINYYSWNNIDLHILYKEYSKSYQYAWYINRSVLSGERMGEGWQMGGRGGGETVVPARKTKQGVYAIINHDNFKQNHQYGLFP